MTNPKRGDFRCTTQQRLQPWLIYLVAAIAVFAQVACATAEVVSHGFGFNARRDSPDVEVLDYRYGDTKIPTASNPEDLRQQGKSMQSTAVFGPMKRPEFLYVKWRLRETGEVFEDTADLRGKLPHDIRNHEIYFIVKRRQLHVYLITPEPRPDAVPPEGPRLYRDRRVFVIYPPQR